MNNKTELVVKSNRLVEASYRLTMVEQHIVLMSIVEGRKTKTALTSDTSVEIRATDYAKTFDIPVNQAYEQMIEAEQMLFNRYVILHEINPKTGKEDKIKTRWVSSVTYPKGGGSIYIQFAAKIIPYITRLEKEFTVYRLERIAKMTSIYAIRIYEILIQWGSIGKREVEVEWLKKTLMVDDKYERLEHFKKRVLDVAISQINELSDLTASYAQRKTGRVVTHLIFTFSQKPHPKQEAAAQLPLVDQLPLAEPEGENPFRMARAPIPPATQAEYLKLRTSEEIGLCIGRANEYGGEQEKAGKPVRYGALYRKAIAEGWHQEKPPQKAQDDTARKQAEASRQQEAQAKRARAEEIRRSEMERELAAAWFRALPDDGKKAMGGAYLAESNPVDATGFKRKGYDYIGFLFFVSMTPAHPHVILTNKLAFSGFCTRMNNGYNGTLEKPH